MWEKCLGGFDVIRTERPFAGTVKVSRYSDDSELCKKTLSTIAGTYVSAASVEDFFEMSGSGQTNIFNTRTHIKGAVCYCETPMTRPKSR